MILKENCERVFRACKQKTYNKNYKKKCFLADEE